jgi:TfoX/Sxy family transcriptional regulator of competence genes
MAYSESLAERVRRQLAVRPAMLEKKMFGGVGFLLLGNMCVGIWKTSLILRLGPEQAAAALKQPDVREFDITGRPMRGWVLVDAEGLESDADLEKWLDQAIDFVSTLKFKPTKSKPPRPARGKQTKKL